MPLLRIRLVIEIRLFCSPIRNQADFYPSSRPKAELDYYTNTKTMWPFADSASLSGFVSQSSSPDAYPQRNKAGRSDKLIHWPFLFRSLGLLPGLDQVYQTNQFLFSLLLQPEVFRFSCVAA